jgi:hypothetical protein
MSIARAVHHRVDLRGRREITVRPQISQKAIGLL